MACVTSAVCLLRDCLSVTCLTELWGVVNNAGMCYIGWLSVTWLLHVCYMSVCLSDRALGCGQQRGHVLHRLAVCYVTVTCLSVTCLSVCLFHVCHISV